MKIDINETIYDIVKANPSLKDYFKSRDIAQAANDKLLETVGKKLSLASLISAKKLNKDLFVREMEDYLSDNSVDTSLNTSDKNKEGLSLTGVLPCPVRIPLLESLENFIDKNGYKDQISHDLKAASTGLDWLIEDLEKGEIADVFMSAGFDLFFDKKYIYGLKEKGMFKDYLSYTSYNEDFENEYISLRDPRGDYSVISVVPAVFLVNTKELGDKKAPLSWKELLSGDYENMVSLPIGDFDLFNAILLNIYKSYGMEGVASLGKVLLQSMHPSEMVKSNKAAVRPAITIMPYFFTKMAKEGGVMKAVWPSDGAIISPIFLVSKKQEDNSPKMALIKDVVDFFGSREVGELLSHNGLFPSLSPEVDNRISSANKYMWIGWDFIENEDIAEILANCMDTFNENSGV